MTEIILAGCKKSPMEINKSFLEIDETHLIDNILSVILEPIS
jgi:hypothetical protein